MMAFSGLLAVFFLFVLAVVFGIIYRVKGVKTAVISTGVMLMIAIVVYVAAIYSLAKVMG